MFDLRVGDEVEVFEKPIVWASHLCGNDPRGLDYPFKFIVEDVDYTESYGALKMSGYGFSAKALVDIAKVVKDETPICEFKHGDKVKIISGTSKLGENIGKIGTLNRFGKFDNGHQYGYISIDEIEDCITYDGDVDVLELVERELINNNDVAPVIKPGQNKMNLFEKFKNAIMDEPRKTLIKYGVETEGGDLTSEGKEVFLNWMYNANKDTFVKEVIDLVKKAEEKEKKDK